MTSEHASRALPLRPGDPTQVGPYQLVGRLGEGGMGTVYLAHTGTGGPVAVKIIRSDLAHDEEFRRRFRSEVDRAREVPPFCTAEVLDADPDHEEPYLVVEYVDGPSLSAVVTERGPLSPANLHGLAIGVATALTAIHGAGVIHRDLKPSNVLLAPGSPKVIDFGIARAVQNASGTTLAGNMIGTVAYMAPERFGATTLTPAADVFAWGSVVAYAGTGRTPFRGGSPPVVATRILTEPPDLGGLTQPLRELVELALAKDPTDRPTARELLDRLLTAGPSQSRSLAVALARQPALLVAAEGAQAATDQKPIPKLQPAAGSSDPAPAGAPAGAAPVDQLGGAGREGPAATGGGLATATAPAVPAQRRPLLRRRRSPAAEAATAAHPDIAVPAPEAAPPPIRTNDPVLPPQLVDDLTVQLVPQVRPRRRRQRLILAMMLAVLVVAGTTAGVLVARSPLTSIAESPAPSPEAADPVRRAAPPLDTQPQVLDKLSSEMHLHPGTSEPNKASCVFEGELVVTKQDDWTYKCSGLPAKLTDFVLHVDVRLLAKGSCAGIWFRNDPFGYALRICEEGYELVTHGVPAPSDIESRQNYPFAKPIPLNAATTVSITARGPNLEFARNGETVGGRTDPQFAVGRTHLGIFGRKTSHQPPYRVSFADLEIHTFTGGPPPAAGPRPPPAGSR